MCEQAQLCSCIHTHSHIKCRDIWPAREIKGREEEEEGGDSEERNWVMGWSPRKTHMDLSCKHNLYTSPLVMCLPCLHDVTTVLRAVLFSLFSKKSAVTNFSLSVIISFQSSRKSFKSLLLFLLYHILLYLFSSLALNERENIVLCLVMDRFWDSWPRTKVPTCNCENITNKI